MKIDLFREEVNQTNKVKLAELKLQFDEDSKELLIDYTPLNAIAVYDVYTNSGQIICTGKIEKEKSKAVSACLKNISPGIYKLCIIDGTDLIEKQLKVT